MKKSFLISVIAHIDAGKTSLVRDLLFQFKQNIDLERLDHMSVEKKHRVTVKLKTFKLFEDNGHIIFLIDTPGHVDFALEVKRSLRISDLCFVLIDVAKGVCSQTLEYLQYARSINLKMVLIFNKIDLLLHESIDDFWSKFKQNNTQFCEHEWEDILWTSQRDRRVGVKNWILTHYTNFTNIEHSSSLFYVLDILKIYRDTGVLLIRKQKNFNLKIGDCLNFDGHKWTVSEVIDHYKDSSNSLCEMVLKGKGLSKSVCLNGNFIHHTHIDEKHITLFHRENLVWINVFIRNNSNDKLQKFRDIVFGLLATDPYVGSKKKNDKFLGFGFEFNFSGSFHLEIFLERLSEHINDLVITLPSVKYFCDQKRTLEVDVHDQNLDVKTPYWTPGVGLTVRVNREYLGRVCNFLSGTRVSFRLKDPERDHEYRRIDIDSPLELLVSNNFINTLRRVTSGFLMLESQKRYWFLSKIYKITVFINHTHISQLDTLCTAERSREVVDKLFRSLHKHIKKKLFEQRIHIMINHKYAKGFRITAARKDVTQKLYGGDPTRRMKLLEQQKIGKQRMKRESMGKYIIDQDMINNIIIDINKSK